MLRTLVPVLATFALVMCLYASPARSGAPSAELLPDLDQEIPSELQVTKTTASRGEPSYVLGFRSAVRNIGEGPLVIKGHRSPSESAMTADQLIERGDGSSDVVAGIGSLRYVRSYDHQHWHYLSFDRYELRRAASSRVLVRDKKTGFCLGDRYRATNVRISNPAPQPVYVGRCGFANPGLDTIDEGISPGYGDDYSAFLEYQDLPLDRLENGRYVLVHRVNSDRKIHELSYANDAASVLLDLRWRHGVPHLRLMASCPDSARCDGGRDPLKSSRIRRSSSVRTAHAARRTAPDPVAHIADGVLPDDAADGTPGGWAARQWNFAGPNGVGAPRAWANLIAAGAPGGAGVTVAVVDTGVAYTNRSPYRISPDLTEAQFVPGWDFVDNDPYPLDENGHGTQVASTIAEETNNSYGLTGLAYGARIMPIRVLDAHGNGDAVRIARGVVYAVDHGATVINISLTFDPSVTAAQIPELLRAFDYATRRGALVVAAAGNDGAGAIDYPARSNLVLAVGATTEFGCVASYSDYGPDLDLVAPGGGSDADLPEDPNCQAGRAGRPIYQVTLQGAPDRFGISSGYMGTSMAAPHVSATAALVVASRVLGSRPTPAAIATRLERTARDLGPAGRDSRYGWGLLDAGAATAPPARKPIAATSAKKKASHHRRSKRSRRHSGLHRQAPRN
jgi:serine protease